MRVDSKPFTVNIAIDSKIIQNGSVESIDLLKKLPKTTPIFFSGNHLEFLKQITTTPYLNFVPVFSTLCNSSQCIDEPEISQIDATGNVISRYLCPNNLNVENSVKKEFISLNNYAPIAGIQLEGLEMPSILSHPGCFCSFCAAIAAEQGLNLKTISHELIQRKNQKSDRAWVQKNFPNWQRFRMQSITNFAGKLMILLRRINPNLFLGLNLNFSETPELLGQDYFFLALYLDLLNFIITPFEHYEKDFLRQIHLVRQVTKKFLGQFKVFLQFSVPDAFELDAIKRMLRTAQKNSFDGVVLKFSTLDGLKKMGTIASNLR